MESPPRIAYEVGLRLDISERYNLSDILSSVCVRLRFWMQLRSCHAPSGTYIGLPRRVRDVSRLGARHGHGPAVPTDRSENDTGWRWPSPPEEQQRVDSHRGFSRKRRRRNL